ncbi:type I-D CRISPR-associated endonuclease Cas1d [Limnoraphis robusta Tam1]|uniref:type I-D CRISPR-associated endonuclease Cas1d n=1 Tax=Limnoraphis robusta TaxID=1118279 RepID=UPI002B2085BD|nr:type I-D CRISPR-associated endonuclease Cas1d [Limnoraphis robusta]MEA5542472.1 type I-D CRISPR-associated endonuclease Cas1d [Limnoraphis robusta Tam1]
MSVLYVTQPDAILNKKYEAFIVSLKQEDGTWSKHSVAAQTVEQVVLMGNPQITGDALSYALELGMPVHYLSQYGKYIGTTLPGYSRNGQLRLAQYATHCDEEKRLELVKIIVAGKIHNQSSVLYRYGQKDNPLKLRKKQVCEQKTLDQVRGIEGIAAREYFACWLNILDEPWSFQGRHHRSPSDPMNVLMNFAYGLLRIQVTAAVHIAGLDPYIGYLHETTRGQPAMVLDLIEEFRPLVADSFLLSLLSHKELKLSDFSESLGAYRLKDAGRKIFLEAFDRKLNSEFKHPVFGYRCTYRRAIELQARLLARHLQENVVYKPLKIR